MHKTANSRTILGAPVSSCETNELSPAWSWGQAGACSAPGGACGRPESALDSGTGRTPTRFLGDGLWVA